jgi:hypothetical protein
MIRFFNESTPRAKQETSKTKIKEKNQRSLNPIGTTIINDT